MGSTNHTPNLDLPQFVATDKPSWLGDVNNAFRDIDKGFGDLKVQTSSVISGQIASLEHLTTLHSDAILKLDSDVAVNTTSINAQALNLQVLEADIDTIDKRERSHFATLQSNIDLNNKSVQDIEDDNVYIKKNMDKIESDVIIATASIAAYKVQVDNLDKKVDTFDNRINDNATDIANLQAETDVLIQRADRMDTDINALQQKDIVTTSSISALDARVTTLESLPTEVANLKQDVADNTVNIANLDNLTTGHTTAIQNLQTKTNGITDGVTVPFGFGVDASGNRGYLQPDNTVQPFFTNKEWQDLQDDINNNMADISDLQTKTAGITDGMTLPYSLAIAPGGAYGYKKNGEQGVTPFVTEEDVNKIVDLQPIEADVETLKTDMSTQKFKTRNINSTEFEVGDNTISTNNLTLMNSDSSNKPSTAVILKPNTILTIKSTIGFGVDSDGNYGYIKAGADTVTPFKSNVSTSPETYISSAYTASPDATWNGLKVNNKTFTGINSNNYISANDELEIGLLINIKDIYRLAGPTLLINENINVSPFWKLYDIPLDAEDFPDKPVNLHGIDAYWSQLVYVIPSDVTLENTHTYAALGYHNSVSTSNYTVGIVRALIYNITKSALYIL